jgi:hypothetical protein
VVTIAHQHIIDGGKCHVWQESQDGDHVFSCPRASFEARSVKRLAGADQVAMNTGCKLVATKDSSRPWIVWIWDLASLQTLAVVSLRDRAKQILWHPTDPEILMILTVSKQPIFYIWHAGEDILISEELAMKGALDMSDCEAKWLARRPQELPLLLLSWPGRYDAGIINLNGKGAVFQSVLSQERWDES